MDQRPLMIVSNRGPVSFRRAESGELEPHRGAGGLVSGLTPLFVGASDRTWLSAALSDDDRAAIAASSPLASTAAGDAGPACITVQADGIAALVLAVDPADLRASYETVCNATLWFVHHHLYELAREPAFDPDWFRAWDAYRRVNHAFADAIAQRAPRNATILIQDYHLYLIAPFLAERRPDLRTVHFSHTPFAAPDMFAVLPQAVRTELLGGMAAAGACGFHTAAWEQDFLGCCAANEIVAPSTFVAPLGSDPQDLQTTLTSPACQGALADLDARVAGRAVIARVDRIEPSKNVLRGFQAYDVLLAQHPEWINRVVFAASVYPSREGNAAYRRYHRDVVALVDAINERWATPDWTPILFDASDDYPRSIATLARADVVLVNPIRDGLNLVAKEAMLVNDRDALLALSANAGAWAEFAGVAAEIDPFDLTQQAAALNELLTMPLDERRTVAATLRTIAGARTPADWLEDQMAAARAER